MFDFKNMARRALKVVSLFHLCVTLPTILSAAYFGLLASDIYISESKFIVRSPSKPETTGFGVLLKTVGYSNSGDEIFAANEYLASRDALRELNQKNAVQRAYGSNFVSIFDRFDPLGLDSSFEALYRYFKHKIALQYESATSITTLTVRAYDPESARAFNQRLLEQAEGLVNRLNERAQSDLVNSAQAEVDLARKQVAASAQALAAYRNRAAILDPEKQAGLQLQMVSKLQDELIATRIQRDQIRAVAPRSSELKTLEARISGLKQSIDKEIGRVAGGSNSLSSAAIEYERRQLESKFADKQLTASLTALEEARLEANRTQVYVERVVEPNLPDSALEPYRIRGILATFVMGLIAWGILSMLLASLRDHVE